jgi:LssY C-terminus
MRGFSFIAISGSLLVIQFASAQTFTVPQSNATGPSATSGTPTLNLPAAPATSTAAAPAVAVTVGTPINVDIPANKDWTDTGIDLRRGDSITLSATGSVQLPPQGKNGEAKTVGPAGQPRGFRDLVKTYPLNTSGFGALLGKIGSSDAAEPFLIGTSKQMQVIRAGRLFVGPNATKNDALTGTYQLTVAFASRGPDAQTTPADLKLPEVTQDMIDRIPRRVVDADGNAGDNTNFVVVGPESKVIDTFMAAGWVKVDKSKGDAVLTGLVSTFVTKQAYLTLPMSVLTLFGRPQDYGLAHAEPIQVVSQRHHLRLWKAPFQVEGQELWVGAATHDIGFDRDQRNNGVTHKIDPNVDDEREYVGRSLDETGLVAKLSYITPGQPSKEAKTATGATFHSDGRVLVLHLVPDSAPAAK